MSATEQQHISIVVPVSNATLLHRVLGVRDEYLRLLQRELGVRLVAREGGLEVHGPAVQAERAAEVLRQMLAAVDKGSTLSAADVRYLLNLARRGQIAEAEDLFTETIVVTERGKRVAPKTLGQARYVDAMKRHDLVFAIGPAGTGKTFLAVAMAVAALKQRQVARIILARPAVEAGEKLGFLPGDIYEKVDPYMRPLYDALYELLDYDKVQRLIERRTVEVIPLAYMRGRTFNDAFIVLDEAQNTTPLQMKMFLTRMGFGAKIVVTGDITQIDLPKGVTSGLVEVQRVLKDVDGVAFVYLTEQDVVRHPLVQRIIQAYEQWERQRRTPHRNDRGEGDDEQ
ncbi:PhoH-like protein [bacterium HR17]|uniref:PhoH-like protein n=1 Tax=Candidatus Fervidibacter japonicus TaxID=2035412 RepID=A0A2H5XDP2_9BACT|nr:PhoH-like protein [bacterium HR17]